MRNFLCRFTAAIVMSLLGGMVISSPALAGNDQVCSINPSLDNKAPILMVHGFNMGVEMWNSLYQELDSNKISPMLFNYKDYNHNWVTDPNIGPALAQRIDCLSQASLKGGGSGKVIVIAHSMGGLATRFAAAQTVDGRKVADELGLVVTLGTPNTGAQLADAGVSLMKALCAANSTIISPQVAKDIAKQYCVNDLSLGSAVKAMASGSSELQALPPFPGNVPVKAIAGDVSAVFDVGLMKIAVLAEGDTFVSTKSATAEFTQTGVGDGEKIFTCEGLVVPLISNAPCSHNLLPSNPAVQQEVKASINQYLASLTSAPAPTGPLTDVYGIKLPLDPTWDVEEASGVAGVYKDSSSPLLSVVGPRLAGNGASIQDATHCTSVSQKGSVTIGGQPATYYEATGCSNGQNKRVWKLANPNIIVESSDTSGVIDTLLKGARF